MSYTIDIKEIQNVLYVCNVNFYEFYVDVESECLTIELNEMIDNIDIDSLIKGLEEAVDYVEFDGCEVISLFW